MRGEWYEDVHLVTRRGAVLRELLRIRCTEPFNRFLYYRTASEGLRARAITYRDIARIVNQNETVARMRVRDIRPPRIAA